MVFMQGCKGCGHLLNQHGDDGCRYRDDINGSCGCDEYEAVLAVSMDKRVEEIRKRNVEERYGAPKEEWAHISDIDYLLAALDQRTRERDEAVEQVRVWKHHMSIYQQITPGFAPNMKLMTERDTLQAKLDTSLLSEQMFQREKNQANERADTLQARLTAASEAWAADPISAGGLCSQSLEDAMEALSAAAPSGSGQAWSQEPLTLAVIEAALAKFTREELTVIAEKAWAEAVWQHRGRDSERRPATDAARDL